ncbi:DUF3301 domain-containing protein [Alteromonadaceae bacterium M269]|nr:DUF3301 domain-containing protein [Alteromonadaceae bacterium M269]
MTLGDILVSVILITVIFQFWRIREIAEKAKSHLNQYCEDNDLQFISVARHKTRLTTVKGRLDWRCVFCVEFSSNGEDAYTGTLVMEGLHVASTDMPAYRIN